MLQRSGRKLLIRRSDLHNVSSIAIKSFSLYVVPRVSSSTNQPLLSHYGSIHQPRRFSHQSVDKSTGTTPPPTSSSSRMTSLVTFTQQSVVYIVHAVVEVIRNPKATWQYIKHEAEHYWLGTKLLWSEIKLATKIFTRVLNGHGMTRRERKQLIRTSMDIFRLVPFAIFVIVPFMEFLLPFALRLFPNMLPSTFKNDLQKEENMKKELQARLAVAGFMQDTLHEMAVARRAALKASKASSSSASAVGEKGADASLSSSTEESRASSSPSSGAKEVIDFIDKARLGEPLPNHTVMSIARLFKDELTLANIARPQLVSMCQYMGLPPYGADAFLRFQLRTKLRNIKEDDRRILWEGIDVLTTDELREACQERGMVSFGLSDFAYKRQLQEWIDLSVQKSIPISLLIMSRAFMLTSADKKLDSVRILNTQDVLQSSMSSLDSDTINEVILAVAKPNEESLPEIQKRKLESLEFQQELIEEEREESEEAKQELMSIKDKASLDKDKAKAAAAAKNQILTDATTAAASVSALPPGYVPGAAGTGDEHLTSTTSISHPSGSGLGGGGSGGAVTASDVANAVMAATVKADVTPRHSPPSTPTVSVDGGAGTGVSGTGGAASVHTSAKPSSTLPSSSSLSSSPASTTSSASSTTTDTEEDHDYSVPPDLTLSELEAITDLARESVLEREKTELALIKANIVADTADDDDEANERNIENKQSGSVVAVKTVSVASTQSTSVDTAGATIATSSTSSSSSVSTTTGTSTSSASVTSSQTTSDKGSDTSTDKHSPKGLGSSLNSPSNKSTDKVTSGVTVSEDVIEAGLIESRMKKALESMVQKLEKKIDTTEAALGEKMNRLLDTDRDGEITFEEFTDALKKTLKRPISDHEAHAIAKLLDSDNDGKVSVRSLIQYAENKKDKMDVEMLEAQVNVGQGQKKTNPSQSVVDSNKKA